MDSSTNNVIFPFGVEGPHVCNSSIFLARFIEDLQDTTSFIVSGIMQPFKSPLNYFFIFSSVRNHSWHIQVPVKSSKNNGQST